MSGALVSLTIASGTASVFGLSAWTIERMSSLVAGVVIASLLWRVVMLAVRRGARRWLR